MRNVIRWAVLALAIALLVLGIHHGLHREDVPSAQGSAGIGIMLLETERGLYVLAVSEGSPADKAGVMPGDYVICADDVTLTESAQLDGLIEERGALQLHLKRGAQELTVGLRTR